MLTVFFLCEMIVWQYVYKFICVGTKRRRSSNMCLIQAVRDEVRKVLMISKFKFKRWWICEFWWFFLMFLVFYDCENCMVLLSNKISKSFDGQNWIWRCKNLPFFHESKFMIFWIDSRKSCHYCLKRGVQG
jgi:hypothetical protein